MLARGFMVLVSLTTFISAHKHGDYLESKSSAVPMSWRRTMESYDLDWWSLYLPTNVESNSSCGRALHDMNEAFTSKENNWAHKMIDSWGKMADGVLYGNRFFFGVYDECVETTSPNNTFHGRYCYIKVKKFTETQLDSSEDEIRPWDSPVSRRTVIENLGRLAINGTRLRYSTCMPDVCSMEDLQTSLAEVLNTTGFIITNMSCGKEFSSYYFDAGDIVFIIILCILAFLLVLASVIDIYIQKSGNKALAKGNFRYLLPFSGYTNVQKLFQLNTEHASGTISCLHGIRALSMLWVVYGHQHENLISFTSNVATMTYKSDGLLYQIITNAYPSVDTFFFMSGFLMALTLLREYKKTRRFNILVFYIHRLVRLIPPIAFICGYYCTIAGYLFSGPMEDAWTGWRSNCRDTWVKDAFLFDNYGNTNILCLGQAWYLAVDFQLYLAAPFIMLPFLYNKTVGKAWLYIVTLLSIIIPMSITVINDYPPTLLYFDMKFHDMFYYVYIKPWCRAGPWVIGIWLGIIIFYQGNKKRKLDTWLVISGWTIALITSFAVVFGMWDFNVFPWSGNYDTMSQVFYSGFHKTAWGAVLAWIVYACHNGYGGVVNEFLSHPIWQPLSRLTYAIYLVALPLLFNMLFNIRVPYYFTQYNKLIETAAILVISIIPSVLISLSVESPIIGLEKLLKRQEAGSNPVKKAYEIGVENGAFEELNELQDRCEPDEAETSLSTEQKTRF